MGKIANLGLAGLLSFCLGCKTVSFDSERAYSVIMKAKPRTTESIKVPEVVLPKYQKLKDVIGSYDNIELKKLNELDFSYQEKVNTSKDLDYIINLSVTKQEYRDKEVFRNNLYEKYELSKNIVEQMSPLELITKAADIVADNFSYKENVNPNKDKFVEQDFEAKIGDCSMYSEFMIKIFNLLKEDNKKSDNVYIGEHFFLNGGFSHDANAVYLISKNKLYISPTDATFYDGGYELGSLDDFHVKLGWRARFYSWLLDYEEALKQISKDIKEAKNIEERVSLLNESAKTLYLSEKYDKAIEAYEILAMADKKLTPDCLFFQIRCHFELKEPEEAYQIIRELLKDYPDCYWSREISKIADEQEK